MLKACVNGARGPQEHPALPMTAAELAYDVAAVAAVGVDAVHLHVKDKQGADTLDGTALAAVLTSVRAAAPGVPVGVTTGAWALPDADARVAAIRSWRKLAVLPDFASVNWHEDGADEVAAALLAIGVGVEAGLWHAEAVEAWLASPVRDRCLRVLLELPDGLDAPAVDAEAGRLLDLVRGVGSTVGGLVLLHGEGSSSWPALRVAGRLGLWTRIGLEDVLVLPDGSTAPDNAALVGAARELLADAHRSGRTGETSTA
ncbi:3-keto-5-aminohexanoate cleavage protein [Pengzhenrongella sp.]|uniref:3-keto-5-aminohexanoate cleavage protein n=1 Tax=Pengzhenrongella sp. TaxID=2888820 RepID=UPI002F9394A4